MRTLFHHEKPDWMKGMRVKPHLARCEYAVRIIVFLSQVACFILVFCWHPVRDFPSGAVAAVAAIVTGYLVRHLAVASCVRIGVISPAEARVFPDLHYRRHWFPNYYDSWLEPEPNCEGSAKLPNSRASL